MAYVVARRNGRFEIRESLHTAKGPRARTLAGFGVLTDEILAAASGRAQRPFDAEAVIGSGRRAGALVRVATSGAAGGAHDRFLASSKSMARTLGRPQAHAARGDAGVALIELLSFADMVRASQPSRPFEPLAFPALSHLTAPRGVAGTAVAHRP
jgi:hypothetical protein